MEIGFISADCRISWARGSRERAKKAGHKGHPCREDIVIISEESNCPVSTIAVGLE